MASPDSGAWGRRQGHTFQVGQRCETSIKAEAKSPEGESSTYLVDRGGDSAPGVGGGASGPAGRCRGCVGRGGRTGAEPGAKTAARLGVAFSGTPRTDRSLRGCGWRLSLAGQPPPLTSRGPAGLENCLLSIWLREKENSYFLWAQGFCDALI